MNVYFYDTPIGRIAIADNGKEITHILLDKKQIFLNHTINETNLIKETYKQISDYLDGKIKTFDIPICPSGTEFQKSVWRELLKIPYGETRSYGKIAKLIGNPKACRAVGMANNKNPILIVIPCHRVIGANGSLVGYGCGIDIKEKLLKLEGSIKC